MTYKVGDRVEIKLHSRTHGYKDTGGGWTTDWVSGTVIKVNRKTVDVRLDQYYYRFDHRVSRDRVRKA